MSFLLLQLNLWLLGCHRSVPGSLWALPRTVVAASANRPTLSLSIRKGDTPVPPSSQTNTKVPLVLWIFLLIIIRETELPKGPLRRFQLHSATVTSLDVCRYSVPSAMATGLSQPCPISTRRPRLLGGQDLFLSTGPSAQHRYQKREFPESNWYTTKVKCSPPKDWKKASCKSMCTGRSHFVKRSRKKRRSKEEIPYMCVYICTNTMNDVEGDISRR